MSGPALGYLLQGSQSVYFAGDTDLFPEMAALGGVDVALLPVAGWGPRLPEGDHMNPRRAAEALKILKPRLAIPIHWGTYTPLWVRGGYTANQTRCLPDMLAGNSASISGSNTHSTFGSRLRTTGSSSRA